MLLLPFDLIIYDSMKLFSHHFDPLARVHSNPVRWVKRKILENNGLE